MFIYYEAGKEVIEYAASELTKYLRMMMPTLDVIPIPLGVVRAEKAITLGKLAELELSAEGVQDELVDDLLDINVDGLTGYIAGSNDRSVLLGVYQYLKAAGCFWANATPDGEYVPKRNMKEFSYTYRKLADHRFRGQCIEGADSFTNIIDVIRWLPKVGMNMFMLEQVVPFNYISRWYDHASNTRAEKESLTYEEVYEMIPVLEAEVKKCGLQLHSLGHGHLFEAYGIHYKTGAFTYELSDLAKSHCAMVKGERKLEKNSPNFTHLCYSNPEARRMLVDWLVSYARKKPYIDFLHLYLADSTNNQCECSECVKKIPADFYVMLLNEIDEAFTKNHIDMRFACILYVDTFWAPETEKLKNPDRFTLTFAMHYNYFGSFNYNKLSREEMPPYVRNQYKTASFEQKMGALDIWREDQCNGLNLMYTYYLYTAQFNDPGSILLSKKLYEDIHRIHEIGFDGMMDDQTQRSFLPTGFVEHVMSRTLFDKSVPFEKLVEEYFPTTFGEDGMAVYEYLEQITNAFKPELLSRGEISIVEQDTGMAEGAEPLKAPVWQYNTDYAISLTAIPHILADFEPVIERNLGDKELIRASSWNYLKLYAPIVEKLAVVIGLGAQGKCAEMQKEAKKLIDYVSEIEPEIQPVFDLCIFAQWLNQKVY